MRRKLRFIMFLIVQIFLCYVFTDPRLADTPEAELRRLFDYVQTGDKLGLEVMVDISVCRRAELVNAMLSIGKGDIQEVNIIETRYNDAGNIAVIDAEVVKIRYGEYVFNRNYYFMSVYDGSWSLYQIAPYENKEGLSNTIDENLNQSDDSNESMNESELINYELAEDGIYTIGYSEEDILPGIYRLNVKNNPNGQNLGRLIVWSGQQAKYNWSISPEIVRYPIDLQLDNGDQLDFSYIGEPFKIRLIAEEQSSLLQSDGEIYYENQDVMEDDDYHNISETSTSWDLDLNLIAEVLDGNKTFEEVQKEKPEAVKETIDCASYYQTDIITSVNGVCGVVEYCYSYTGELIALIWQGIGLSEQDYLSVLDYISEAAELDETVDSGYVNSEIYIWNNEVDIILQDCIEDAEIVRLYFRKHIRRNDSEQSIISKPIDVSVNGKEFKMETLMEIVDFDMTIEAIHELLGEADYQEAHYGVYTLYYYDCILNGQKGTLSLSYEEVPGLYWESEDGFDGYQELVDASRQFGEVEDQTTYDIRYKYKEHLVKIRQETTGYSFIIQPYIEWDEEW